MTQSTYIQFACDEDDKNRNPFNVNIYGEASNNPITFSTDNYNISSRTKTDASVNWSGIEDWIVEHEAGEGLRTPDLTPIIQEIISRPGWASVNAMAFILEGTGCRTAESFYGTVITYPFEAVSVNPPAVPENLIGSVISYTDIQLNWIYNDDPQWPARHLHLEHKTGPDSNWVEIELNISPTSTTYLLSNPRDGTDYYFRMRANNIFGFSAYTDEVLVSTPVDTRLKVVFQQGKNNYDGTVDLELRNALPDDIFDGTNTMSVDMEDDGDIDLMLHFKTQELDLTSESTKVTLRAETSDCKIVISTNSIKLVP